ncbi:hypothetical protein F511_44013 [Dorcoceras hygrometricum]|uniref:Uncharacterized protein n=1 Tax=Dorcoceras hygrometricum TaxID=472368 RepID=A0A2Z7ARC6_9LAMI|nr:hypothetical protein F511_44013 [Dorcoceras hygrometricum]
MESAVMTSALMSSQSAVGYQQMRRVAKKIKRRHVERSADGLALMTSSVTSSQSADGLREQSQESAGSLYIQTQERSDVVEEISSRKLLFISRFYLEIAIAKRCRLHKLIRQRFALALKIQQILFALITSRKILAGRICLIPAEQPVARSSRELQWIQTQAIAHPVESFNEPAVAMNPVASFAIQSTWYPDARKEEAGVV